MKKIAFGIVGYGHIGKRHAEMIERNPHAEILAICDSNSLAFGESKINQFDSYAKFLSELKGKADVICICTPNGLHSSMANTAIQHGFNVLIEKPLGLSKKNCEEVIFNALSHNKQVFCVMQNRYSPPSLWLKEVVDSGILGKIYMVQLNCFWNRDERYYLPKTWHGDKNLDGGTLFTQFSHFIDMLYWLFGDIDNIHARVADFSHQNLSDFEDSGLVTFNLENSALGSINFSTSVYDKNQESSITIIAENGSIKVGGQYMNQVDYCHIKNYKMPTLAKANPANDYGAFKGSAANHAYVIQNVVDVLNNKNTSTTNALEGLKVVDIIERIYSAAKSH